VHVPAIFSMASAVWCNIKQHDLGAGGERSRATISPNEVSRARNAD
jgi:hypothetical protein